MEASRTLSIVQCTGGSSSATVRMAACTSLQLGDVPPQAAPAEAGPTRHALQFVPARVAHNGPAHVRPYFTRQVSPVGPDGRWSGTLRGFPVDGQVVAAPAHHDFLVLQGGGPSLWGAASDATPPVLRATHRLSEFTQWNYDSPPHERDPVRQSLIWLSLAEAIHVEPATSPPAS